MRKDKAEFLLTQHPTIFSTFLAKVWGAYIEISVGDGWFNLLLDMLMKLDKLINTAYIESGTIIDIDCVQLKEKFGGLRFYYNVKIKNESKSSIFFSKVNHYIGLKLCRKKLYRQYWAFDRFRQKYLYQTHKEKISMIVNEASMKSSTACEVCGETGWRRQPKGTYWVRTLCKKHHDESKHQ